MSEVLHQELGLPTELISRLQEKAAQDEDLNLLIQCVINSPAQKLREQLGASICNNDQVVHDLSSKYEEIERKFKISQKELLSSRTAMNKLRKRYLKSQNEKISNSLRDGWDNSDRITEIAETLSSPNRQHLVEKQRLQATIRETQATILKLKHEVSDEKFRCQKAVDAMTNLELEKEALQKQVELTKSQCEETLELLALKSSELAKCRADKASHVAELEANFNQLQTENQVLKRTTKLYLTQRDELSQKLAQSQESIHKVEQKIASQEQLFQNELGEYVKLKTFYEEMTDSLEKRVNLLENELNTSDLEHHRYVAQVEMNEIQTKDTIDNLQEEIKQLSEENTKLLAICRENNSSEQSDSLQTIAQLQLDLLKANRDNRSIQQNLKELVVNIKLKQPILEEQKCQYDFMVQKNKELNSQLSQCQAERDIALFESRETKSEIYQLDATKKAMGQQINRISRQVQMLLCQHEKQSTPSGLEAHLTPFRDIQDLHRKNSELQTIVDELVVRFEAEELRLKAKIEELHAALDGDVQPLVDSSAAETQELRKRVRALEADLSICDRIIKASVNSKKQVSDISPEHELIVSRLEHEVAVLKEAADEAQQSTSSKIENLRLAVSSKDVHVAQLNATVSHLEAQLRMREQTLQMQMLDTNENRLRTAELEGQLVEFTRREGELSCSLEKERVVREQLSRSSQLATQELQEFKALAISWKTERSRLALKVAELSAEVSRLQASLQDSNSRLDAAQDRHEKHTQSVEAERDEALSRLNACFQTQDSQVARHERFVVSAEERLLRLRKESEAKVDLLQQELNDTKEESQQLQHQIENLQATVVRLQSQARSLPAHEQSSAPADTSNLKMQLEEKIVEYQTVREALEELSSTYAQYKAQASSQLAQEKENCSRLQTLQQELTAKIESLTQQVTTLEEQSEALNLSISREKSSYEREILMLQDTIVELENAQKGYEDEIFSLKAIAEHATLSYEEELVGHADKIRMVALLKDEINGLKAQITQLQLNISPAQHPSMTNDQTAMALAQLSQANARIQDLEQLNQALKTQFESTGTVSVVDPGVETRQLIKQCTDDTLIKMESLSNANKLLQLDISSLTAELNKTRQELETVRAKCRSLHQEELEEMALQNKFLDESNCFLRGERDQLAKKVADIEEQLENSLNQVSPFKDEMQSLKTDLEAKEAEINLLRKENEQWTARLQSMLQGQRIDPREYDAIREESLSLQAKLGEAQKTIAELEERNASAEVELGELKNKCILLNRRGISIKRRLEQVEAEKSSLSSAPLESFNKLQAEHNDLRSKHQELTSTSEAKSQQLGKLQNELNDLRSKHQELSKTLEDKSQVLLALQECLDGPEAQLVNNANKLKQQLQNCQSAAKALREKYQIVFTSYKAAKTTQAEVAAELKECRTELEDIKKTHQTEIQNLQESSLAAMAQLEMRNKARLSKPKKELELLREELANLKGTNQKSPAKRPLSPSSNLHPEAPSIPLKKARSEGADPANTKVDIPSLKEEAKIEAAPVDSSNQTSEPLVIKVSEQDYDFLLDDDLD
ncbi:Protein mlp1 [Entomophthora muscae]|uniref:Protein mlp1 n=1 Tax=Entomophthora muscae TaxID=34485 RepID=A0ACC2S2T0_9FUNG|nr:Protein mlp1 [Entomophthora muscae]